MRVTGCDTTPTGSAAERSCTSAVESPIDPSASFTLGPLAANSGFLSKDTLYIVLEAGEDVLGDPLPLVLPDVETCFATVEIDSPPHDAGTPPAWQITV